MQNEAAVIGGSSSTGNLARREGDTSELNALYTTETNAVSVDVASQLEIMRSLRQQEELMVHAPGRKLDGRSAPTARVSEELRYKQTKMLEQAAVLRQWEDSVLRGAGEFKQQLLPSRIFYSRARGYPLCAMSILQYAPEAEHAKMEKNKNIDVDGLTAFNQSVRDWRGNSFMPILQVGTLRDRLHDIAGVELHIYIHNLLLNYCELQAADGGDMEDFLYDPNALDDPELAQVRDHY